MNTAKIQSINFNDFLLFDDIEMPSPILPMKNYVISRRVGADSDDDPTGALDFWPAKGSDELYEALKEAFPAYRTHKERMREAVLDFLLQERDQDAMQSVSRSVSDVGSPLERRQALWNVVAEQVQVSANASFVTMPDSAMPSPAYFMHQHQHHHQGSFHTTPEYLPSPESQFTNTFPSTPATSAELSEQISAIPNSMSVPGLREMTTVWSVAGGSQPKVRTRRAMTEAEKKEYRRKRIDGACSDCRRRRRKCDHESSESDSSSKCVKKAKRSARATAGITARLKAAPVALSTTSAGRSSTGTSPNQASYDVSPRQQGQQQNLIFDASSSISWPANDLLGFSDLEAEASLADELISGSSVDPFFDFVDFDQGSDDVELHQSLQTASQSQRLRTTANKPRQQQHVPSSGMIMPLPSYYAPTEALQDLSWNGGTANLLASPTNTLSMLRQQYVAEDYLGVLQTQEEPHPPSRSDRGGDTRRHSERTRLRVTDVTQQRTIPSRTEVQTDGIDDSARLLLQSQRRTEQSFTSLPRQDFTGQQAMGPQTSPLQNPGAQLGLQTPEPSERGSAVPGMNPSASPGNRAIETWHPDTNLKNRTDRGREAWLHVYNDCTTSFSVEMLAVTATLAAMPVLAYLFGSVALVSATMTSVLVAVVRMHGDLPAGAVGKSGLLGSSRVSALMGSRAIAQRCVVRPTLTMSM